MKSGFIILFAVLLSGCAMSEHHAKLSPQQVVSLVKQAMPPLQHRDSYSYSLNHENGGWRVYISSIGPVTGADIDYLVGVATVRDSDGKVDFIKKP